MKKGLVIIDVQNDYFKSGNFELLDMELAAANCHCLLEHFRTAHLPVFHIQHICAYEGATFFLPNTFGCDIHESVKPGDGEPRIIKYYPNAFRETSLLTSLQSFCVNELVVCGAMSHMCIDSTVRAAFDMGFPCTVIADACATRDQQFGHTVVKAAMVHAAFMAALQYPFARVTTTQEFLKDV